MADDTTAAATATDDKPTDTGNDSLSDIEQIAAQADKPDAVRAALQAERDTAKEARDRADAAEAKVKEFEDRDKSDQQRKEEAAAEADRRATAAESKALRYEVAAAKGIPLEQAHRLQGSTKDELEKDAEEFKKSLGEQQQRTGFDGGTRQPVPAGDMDAQIRRAAGRG